MVTTLDPKLKPAKLNLVMEQWKQYDTMTTMTIIILVMDIIKNNLVIGCDGSTDIGVTGMWYVCVFVSLHTPKKKNN